MIDVEIDHDRQRVTVVMGARICLGHYVDGEDPYQLARDYVSAMRWT